MRGRIGQPGVARYRCRGITGAVHAARSGFANALENEKITHSTAVADLVPPSNALCAAMRVWLGYPKSVAAAMISANSGHLTPRDRTAEVSEISFWQEGPIQGEAFVAEARRLEEAAGTRESWDDAVPDLVP